MPLYKWWHLRIRTCGIYCLTIERTIKGQQVLVPSPPGGHTPSKSGDLVPPRDSSSCEIVLPDMELDLPPFSFLPQASAVLLGVSGNKSNNLPW